MIPDQKREGDKYLQKSDAPLPATLRENPVISERYLWWFWVLDYPPERSCIM